MSLLQKVRDWFGSDTKVTIEDGEGNILTEQQLSERKIQSLQDVIEKGEQATKSLVSKFDEDDLAFELKIQACDEFLKAHNDNEDIKFNKIILNEKRDKCLTRFIQESKALEIQLSEVKEELSKAMDTGNTPGKEFPEGPKAKKKKKIQGVDVIKNDLEKSESYEGQYANVIVHKDDKILFLKRAADKVLAPNQYCLPGGHIDVGETPIQAASRELEEETNLKVKPEHLFGYGKIKCDNGKWAYYYAISNPDDALLALLDGESSNVAWMTREQWNKADLFFDLKDHLDTLVPNPGSDLPTINISKAKLVDVLLKASDEQKGKVQKVMDEWKSGELKSSSGDKVSNHKQAVAIALSEAGLNKKKKSKKKLRKAEQEFIINYNSPTYQNELSKAMILVNEAIGEGIVEQDGIDKLIKGKKAGIGEKRTWGGKQYEKTSNGWKLVKSEKASHTSEQLAQHAASTSSSKLKRVAYDKQTHPSLSDAARKEMERRRKEDSDRMYERGLNKIKFEKTKI